MYHDLGGDRASPALRHAQLAHRYNGHGVQFKENFNYNECRLARLWYKGTVLAGYGTGKYVASNEAAKTVSPHKKNPHSYKIYEFIHNKKEKTFK